MLPEKKRVTLKNIADECGYSVNTVSRALRDDTRLPAETLAKIQATARNLGYIRNNLASSLRSGKTHTIAVIADEIQNPYYSSIISQLDLKLKEAGYNLLILCTQAADEPGMGNVNERLGREMINVAISHSVDGILCFPYASDSHMADPIMQNHIPFVLIGRELSGLETDVVRCDDYAGGYLAGQELFRLGHRKYLYISGPSRNTSQCDREKGFFDALTVSGISRENIRIISFENIRRSIKENNITELLTPIDYTAIFSFNDHMAYPVISCLLSENFRIPEDISIIGFDHIRYDVPYALPLTSIAHQNCYNFADSIVELLLSRIENPELPPRAKILPITIYDEGTIGPVSGK